MANKHIDKILLIDDDPISIKLLSTFLDGLGYTYLHAKDGVEGWELLQDYKNEITLILLDCMMPRMDGFEFMKNLKSAHLDTHIPVIMQSARATKEQKIEAINAGIYYYLTKPFLQEEFNYLVKSAIYEYKNYNELRNELSSHIKSLSILKNATFQISSYGEIKFLSMFLADFFPDPENALLGISEMLLNALEHGNLGISYKDKTEFIKCDALSEEVNMRALSDANKNKVITVVYTKEDNKIILKITDQGNGFHWNDYLEIDPTRLSDTHGRGIALSRLLSFDSIEYIKPGNKVICSVYIDKS